MIITPSYIKTIVNGLLNRIKNHEISEEEVLELMVEEDIVQPATNNDGSFFTNSSNQIFIL